MDRRFFSKFSLSAASLLAISGFDKLENHFKKKVIKDVFVHQVYFWLHNPTNPDDRKKFLEGIELLKKCKSIQSYHVGKPAGTSRAVIDASYTYSWLTIFKNAEDEQAYQVDPIHLQFIKEYQHLWTKVIVYDSIDI